MRETLQPSSTRTSTVSPGLPGGSSCHQNQSAHRGKHGERDDDEDEHDRPHPATRRRSRRGSSSLPAGPSRSMRHRPPLSSHDCNITAAATLSTTSRRSRRGAFVPRWSARFGGDRGEALVVERRRRSPGPPRRCSSSTSARAACAAGPSLPRQRQREPDDDRRDTRARGRRRRSPCDRSACEARTRSSTSCGDATVRLGSESARPIRRSPRSTPSDPVRSRWLVTALPLGRLLAQRAPSASSTPSTFAPPPATDLGALADATAERAWPRVCAIASADAPARRRPC